MAISSDDQGYLKLWDMRTLQCIQTLHIGDRYKISNIIDLYKYGYLGFSGAKINIIEFEKKNQIKQITTSKDK